MEIWKTINYATKYEISNLGNIKNIKSKRLININIERHKKDNKRVRPGLINNEGKNLGYYLHRIVAQHFIDNPNNLPEVNHIDGDFYNNKADNLEWISKMDNMKHANDNNLIKRYKRGIIITHKVTGEEKVFDKGTECAKFLKISPGLITLTCQGKRTDKIWHIKYEIEEKQEEINENIIWKEYPECPKYLVSNTGEVKRSNKSLRKSNRLLMGGKQNGYISLTLFIKDRPNLNRLVHRMVAQTFLDNPNNLPVVNHKDTNILNNQVDNLEWVTYKQNMNTEVTIKNLKKGKNSKTIHQIEIESGEIVNTFDGACESEKSLKISTSQTLQICNYYNGNKKYAGSNHLCKTYQNKYIFIFDEDKDKIKEFLEISKINNNEKRKKPVIQINKSTGEIVNNYESCYEASKKLNIAYSTLSNICRYYSYTDENRPETLKYYHSNKGLIYKYT
jgi:hypothetical protein